MGTRRNAGRVSFAIVPHEQSWRARLFHPLATLTNLVLTAWMWPIWRSARIRWDPPADRLREAIGATNRQVIYYSWHEYEPLIMLGFRDVPDSLTATAIGHDGLLSRMLQRTGARLGYHVWIFRRKSPIRPKDQIIDLMRKRGCNIGLIPDAGGPYRRVKPGIADIARATNALVVPIVPRGRRTLTVPWPKPFRFPLPFCSLTVHCGAPLDGSAVTVEDCQVALESLERAVRDRHG